ncbi:putative ERCC4 domain containing protein [Lyophyllum shimeji]|uniref:ERCC4 domain containing protein n=1 Tax=Lyophyllum shimeji TaxID=47721 RepID=A0A9P3PJF9_LYOSH|nr:putative ERCC4 domain containing protein [Lyophyllum shimeji]
MSTLLPFHKAILEQIHDPATSELLILARGLGLRRIICTLMKIYDSPQNLVLLVNATPEEESEIGEELGIMGCRKPGLRVVGYETGSKDRQDLYKKGGLISVTSRILVVDMLQGDIPTHLITGILVMHAEKVTPLVLEAFIVRLYREKNKNGFLKAFTDQPEHITSGLSPLRNIMKELQLRKVHIYPRFQEDVKKSLERRRADVVELSQPLTEAMADIHHAIIQCMSTTISELKRSNATLDLDDFNVENAYFRSFDVVVRRQLDSVWHKVGPRTKQLVNDLGTLRRLLYYLLTYDPLQFHAYLETLIASNSTTASGGVKQHQSPWLLTDAAHIIFQVAKRRCYTVSSGSKVKLPQVIDLVDDEDAWQALDEIENGHANDKGKQKETRPTWLPEGMEPVLEELPKWNLLAEILQEAEEEMLRHESLRKPITAPNIGSNTVLVMASSTRTCGVLTEFLSTIDHDAPNGTKGRRMMLRKLRLYLWWKSKLAERKQDGKSHFALPDGPGRVGNGFEKLYGEGDNISEALKKKDKVRAERAASRRRVRGGAPAAVPRDASSKNDSQASVMGEIQNEAETFAQYWESQGGGTSAESPLTLADDLTLLDFESGALESEFDEHYGLLAPEQTVLVRAYSDDTDDRMLAEIQPKFIVMFEPNMEFIRRIEVYKSSHPGLAVRVYHMVYGNSCEEHKYLAGIRKEKESFERLIKERGSMLLPLYEERRDGVSDAVVKTISTRIAGGRRELSTQPSQVIVDMREFRSTLPSLLHASNMLVIPATLTVGDYIITPEICVERKSLSDLISSFNSGRLYTQCELMSVHYKTPMLLIEFEEDKAFTLDVVSDIKLYAKPTGKYPTKKKPGGGTDSDQAVLLQSKICLLMLTFPRVRIIWSSSPYATAEIFRDLKMNNPEPDPTMAIAIGADDDPEVGAGVNAAAEELLRCLPGITAKNIKHVMNRISTVRELCEMDIFQVQELLDVMYTGLHGKHSISVNGVQNLPP